MARDRAFRSNSFGISATIAFAFVMPNSRYLYVRVVKKVKRTNNILLLNFRLHSVRKIVCKNFKCGFTI
ncbi:hypothetical protein [Leptospira noguchii]|uniref:hypothetical protein n=1 Tax=Leptospira noguchii TaxID=28182 RepID=UPI0012DA46A3